jgi:hypothetical protein
LPKLLRDDSVNPTPIIATVEIEMLFQGLRQRPRMFDHFAIHVANIEATIGGVCELHRPKPVVRAGKEFSVLFIRRTYCLQRSGFIAIDLLSMNQIPAGIADEGISRKIIAVCVPAVNRYSSGPGEISAGLSASLNRTRHKTRHPPLRAKNAPGFVGTQAEDGRRSAIHRNFHQCPRKGESRV